MRTIKLTMKLFFLASTLAIPAANAYPLVASPGSPFSEKNLLKKAQEIGMTVSNQHDTLLRRHLAADGDPPNQICSMVADFFMDDVDCDCQGSFADTFTFSCEMTKQMCQFGICGRPSFEATLESGMNLANVKACVYDYEQFGTSYDDICVSGDFCDNRLCDCNVAFGEESCETCEICQKDFMSGIDLDCSNVNAQVVISTCEVFDIDLSNLSSGKSDGTFSIARFIPNFEGICSQINEETGGLIECDCSSNEGNSFALSCGTTQDTCNGEICGKVNSTVTIEEGNVQQVDACVDFGSSLGGEVCTSMTLCPENLSICDCEVVVDGKKCNSCETCVDDFGRNGLSLNCLNVNDDLVLGSCQAVTPTEAFKFIPEFRNSTDLTDGVTTSPTTSETAAPTTSDTDAPSIETTPVPTSTPTSSQTPVNITTSAPTGSDSIPAATTGTTDASGASIMSILSLGMTALVAVLIIWV